MVVFAAVMFRNIEIRIENKDKSGMDYAVGIYRTYTIPSSYYSTLGFTAANDTVTRSDANISLLNSTQLPRSVYLYFKGMKSTSKSNVTDTITINNNIEKPITVYVIRTQTQEEMTANVLYNQNYGTKVDITSTDFDGVAFVGVSDDLVTGLVIAICGRRAGRSFLLDFHYSDFWADTGKQVKPKAWKNYELPRLCEAVKRYTVSVLEYLTAAGVCPDYIQPGNEISNGILWPEGKFPQYKAAVELIEAAISGIRYAAPEAKIVLHTSAEPEHPVYTEFLDAYGKRLDYDIIGISYFPYKKSYGLSILKENLKQLADKYHKQVCVVETAMPYTTQDYAA